MFAYAVVILSIRITEFTFLVIVLHTYEVMSYSPVWTGITKLFFPVISVVIFVYTINIMLIVEFC